MGCCKTHFAAVGRLWVLEYGTWAAQPPGDGRVASVVFRKDLTDAQIRDRLTATGAAILWQDAGLSLAVVDMPAGGAWRLYGQGALLVAGGGLPAGCLGWRRT